jgi:hypothetical protein
MRRSAVAPVTSNAVILGFRWSMGRDDPTKHDGDRRHYGRIVRLSGRSLLRPTLPIDQHSSDGLSVMEFAPPPPTPSASR